MVSIKNLICQKIATARADEPDKLPWKDESNGE